jgi:hypothetical protein
VQKHLVNQDAPEKGSSSKRISESEFGNFEIPEANELDESEGIVDLNANVSILESQIEEIRKNAVQFVVQLKSSGKLPLSACQEILVTVTKVLNSIIGICGSITKEKIDQETKLQLIEKLKDPFAAVSSDYLLKKHLKESGHLILPQEVVLGSFLKPKKGKHHLVFDTYQYVPIEAILKKVLEMPGVMKSILEVNKHVSESVYNSPASGTYLKSKISNSEYPMCLLIFYYDEVEVCNPLGSRHGVHKLGNCYISILNTYSQYASKLANIYLCCSFETKLLAKYPIAKILQHPVNALSSLGRQGLNVQCNEYTGKVNICLGQVTGDNLGLHQVFGFTESFVSNFPCRFCRMPRYKCMKAGTENILFRRDQRGYEADLKLGNLSKTGVKTVSVFNEIPSFHITQNYCPDIMHDVLEGVAPLNMKLIMKKLIKQGVLTLDKLNTNLASFNYRHLQKDKPSIISEGALNSSDARLGQSAGQTFCLLQNFAFLFAKYFDENDSYWNLMITFLEIMDIIMSPCVSESSLPYLKHLIEDHHSSYQKLSQKSLIPKHHHMLHYPEAIRKVGPLHYYWTMRFEARHKFFKHVAKIGSNFKNIAKSVSTRNQMLLSYKFFENKPFEQYEVRLPEVQTISLSEFKNEWKEFFIQNLQMDENGEVDTFKFISINGNDIKADDIMLLTWLGSNEFPEYIRVCQVVGYNRNYQIFAQKLLTNNYHRHYHAFIVEETEQYVLLNYKDIDLCKPLLCTNMEGPDSTMIMLTLPYVLS